MIGRGGVGCGQRGVVVGCGRGRVGGIGNAAVGVGGVGSGRLSYERKPGNVEYKLKRRKLLFSLRKNFNDWAFGVAMVGVVLMIVDREYIMSEIGRVNGVDIESNILSLTLR